MCSLIQQHPTHLALRSSLFWFCCPWAGPRTPALLELMLSSRQGQRNISLWCHQALISPRSSNMPITQLAASYAEVQV